MIEAIAWKVVLFISLFFTFLAQLTSLTAQLPHFGCSNLVTSHMLHKISKYTRKSS